MKSPKYHVWKWRIALMTLVAWILLDGVELITQAQVQPPRRRRGVMISPEDLKKKDEVTVDIGKSLVEIAQRASRQSTNQMVDLVLVVDGSLGMKGPGSVVEARVVDIATAFEESMIDYQFGLVWFQNAGKISQITVKPLQAGLIEMEDNFRNLPPPKFGGRVAGHGLDAIMKGLEDLQFRSAAEKHLIVVTNSKLKTSWGGGDEQNHVVGKILDLCKRDKIHINMIGIGQEIQIQLADYTEGKWYAIDKYQRKVNRAPLIDKSILKIDGIFRRIAQHIASTAEQPIDLIFVYDSSFSMDGKVDEICAGLDTLIGILDGEGIDYRFGIIRFWAQLGGGASSMTITQPPLSAEQIKKLFQMPRRGDEHLLDAIIESVPKLRTPDDRKLVLFIVTDEPSSAGHGTEYTSTKAVAVCRHVDAQVYAIGGVMSGSSVRYSTASDRAAEEFQRLAPAATNGQHYIMPEAEVPFQNRLIQ